MISILEKEKQESAKDYVLRVLIHSIVNTELKPGERLVDQEICNLLGVSRTPFREAELGLAQKKLIEIKPKIGTYVSYIDPGLVEEVRHLRSVLEAEIAVMACDLLTSEDIDRLWENIALWQLYIKRGDEEKMFYYDKEFHKMLYHMCGRSYWCELVEGVAPHFDRTTILSFRCQTKEKIYVMTIEANGIILDVCINQQDLVGEPAVGRRFRGIIWLQGLVHFEEDVGNFLSAGELSGYDDMQITVCGNEERILLVSRFDNLGKGASGAAIQNMNISLGVEDSFGLNLKYKENRK